MPTGNRLVYFALGLLTGIILLLFAVSDLSVKSTSIEQDAAQRANEYGKDAQAYKQRRCAGLAGAEAEDCQRKADQTARENQRVELDLAAQRVTAWWTQIMGAAAMIGMALSTLGVWLVYTTFGETKRAADAAHEANRLLRESDRPYILFDGMDVGDVTSGELLGIPVTRGLIAKLKFKNFGKGLAKNVKASHNYAVMPHGAPYPTFACDPDVEHAKAMLAPGQQMRTGLKGLNDAQADLFFKQDLDFYLWARIDYTDDTGISNFFTEVFGLVVPEGRKKEGDRMSLNIAFENVGPQNDAN